MPQATATRPRHLRAVPDPGPVTPATPCPPWCSVRHVETSDRFHYGPALDAGAPIRINPEVLDDGTLAARAYTDHAGDLHLTISEIDDLIDDLEEVRQILAAEQARRTGAAAS